MTSLDAKMVNVSHPALFVTEYRIVKIFQMKALLLVAVSIDGLFSIKWSVCSADFEFTFFTVIRRQPCSC